MLPPLYLLIPISPRRVLLPSIYAWLKWKAREISNARRSKQKKRVAGTKFFGQDDEVRGGAWKNRLWLFRARVNILVLILLLIHQWAQSESKSRNSSPKSHQESCLLRPSECNMTGDLLPMSWLQLCSSKNSFFQCFDLFKVKMFFLHDHFIQISS